MATTQRQSEPKSETDEKRKPVHTIDFFPIRVAVWENETDQAKWYAVTATRRYRVEKRRGVVEYGNSPSLNTEDLLATARALELAYEWIQERRRKDYLATRLESEEFEAEPTGDVPY